ncbi:MAG: M20 family metallopeptidase [Gemella sp.]|nr:M20 family metallopeptidase [Gemella sp.]
MKVVTNQMLTKWRRDLHSNPELSLEEYKTKEYLKTILEENNIAYEEVLETGLIVKFEASEKNAETILFRADIDALPIQEENQIDFASKTPGVMHACGHDGHTAMLLGAMLEAKKYHETNETKYNSMFVFQPAEETIGGAALMVNAYDFKKHNIKAAYALHMNPDYEESAIISKEKDIMASATEFRIKIEGQAAHVGLKHTGSDAINTASIFYQELLKLNTLNLSARDTNIIHIGLLSGGDALNIVAQSAKLEGTIRTYSRENFVIISKKIIDIAKGLELITGTKINVDFGEGYDAVYNDKEEYNLIKEVCKNNAIKYIELKDAYLYGEDFSAFRRVAPTNYSFLGIRNEEKGYVWGLHTPKFNFDEIVLETGVKYYMSILDKYNKG